MKSAKEQVEEALNEICTWTRLSRTGHHAKIFRRRLEQMVELGFEAARELRRDPHDNTEDDAYQTPDDFLKELK